MISQYNRLTTASCDFYDGLHTRTSSLPYKHRINFLFRSHIFTLEYPNTFQFWYESLVV